MTLQKDLDELASAVCKKAREADTQLDQRIDALKALTTYYAVREKVKAKNGDADGSEDGDFGTFQTAIHAAAQTEHPHGAASKPSRSRSRAS